MALSLVPSVILGFTCRGYNHMAVVKKGGGLCVHVCVRDRHAGVLFVVYSVMWQAEPMAWCSDMTQRGKSVGSRP